MNLLKDLQDILECLIFELKKMYLVSFIGIYPCNPGDYTVRLYRRQQTAKCDFDKMIIDIMNYYNQENIKYSIEESDNYCCLLLENGDNVKMFIQNIQSDGITHNIML